jgi:hypothetical protein
MFDMHNHPLLSLEKLRKYASKSNICGTSFFPGNNPFQLKLEDSAQGQFEQVSFARKDRGD